jgi:hypothetical protein
MQSAILYKNKPELSLFLFVTRSAQVLLKPAQTKIRLRGSSLAHG